MKDAYSFDIDDAGLDLSYDKHDRVYRNIFTRCGLEFVSVEADSGAMGGSQSQEFMVYTEAGEDLIASCPACGYAANLERATSRIAPVEDLALTGDGTPELVHTPNQRTIDEVGAFLSTQPHHQIKTMAYMAELPAADHAKLGKLRAVVVFLRGDHQLNEAKLAALAGTSDLRPMTAEEILATFNAPAGYLGPIGVTAAPHPKKPGTLVILDKALEGRTNLIAGANQAEYHLRNVTPTRDFKPTVIADVRNINEGEACPTEGCSGTLRLGKAVEIGHIFKLGRKYTTSMGSSVLNRDGKEVTPTMGCYGIGIERILTAAIETSAAKFAAQSDAKADTYALPPSIAPFEVVVTVTNTTDAELSAAGERVAADLENAGFDVLLDDRDERAGVKFKDADLTGIPYRINIGKKLTEGKVELVDRLTGTTQDVLLAETVQTLRTLFRNPQPIPVS
jgi:prolyl-tRNA synthetase